MQTIQSQPLRRSSPTTTVRIAWLVLLLALAVFSSLVALAGYTAWQYRVNAMLAHESVLIVRGRGEWITWRPQDRSVFQRVADAEQVLHAGDEVRIADSAGYGQVATIRLFDQSTLDLWAGAEVSIDEARTSRWNDRTMQVVLRQKSGYVRYDLRADQLYQQVRYQVIAGGVTIDLQPGGSYSVEMLPPERQVLRIGAEEEQAPPHEVDIAVRAGRAEVAGVGHGVTLTAGLRVQVDSAGMLSLPIPARWELIQDGDFDRYSEEAYNNTTFAGPPTIERADTWQVYSIGSEGAAANGFFKVARVCRPPQTGVNCDLRDHRHAAWFIRSGGQTKSFVTGIRQLFGPDERGADISEYRSLVLTAWVRVLNQSVALTGEQGTECPVMIRLLGKQNSPVDPERERVICIYSSPVPADQAEQFPGVHYYWTPQYEWFPLRIELRDPDWLPDYRYLRGIEIYANGHDYDARVTGVSLIGSQSAPLNADDRPVSE